MTVSPQQAFVSFVIITRNSAQHIHKCFESIKKVDYPNEMYEIVVVDGGSTDETAEISRSYGAKVIVVDENDQKNKRSLGMTQGVLSKSRNVGVANSQGEFVAFVDDDAQITKEWLKLLLNKGFREPDVAGATGSHFLPPSTSRTGRYIGVLPIQTPSTDSLNPVPFVGSSDWSEMVTENNPFLLSTKACCYRRAALLKIGGFDENLYWSEDPDINATLLKNGYKLAFVPEAKAGHQTRQNLLAFGKQQIKAGLGHANNVQKYPDLLQTRWALLLTLMFMVVGLAFFSVISRLALGALVFVLVSYILFLMSYGIRASYNYDNLGMLLGVPFVCATWQFCWGWGFIYGLFFQRYKGN